MVFDVEGKDRRHVLGISVRQRLAGRMGRFDALPEKQRERSVVSTVNVWVKSS